MKLVNKSMAGQKLSLSSGVIAVDVEGCIETEDKAVAEALQRSGFKLVFARKVEPKAEPRVEPKAEPKDEPKTDESLSSMKVDHQKKKGK